MRKLKEGLKAKIDKMHEAHSHEWKDFEKERLSTNAKMDKAVKDAKATAQEAIQQAEKGIEEEKERLRRTIEGTLDEDERARLLA